MNRDGANAAGAIRAPLRRCIADEVEWLIAILNEFDGYADCEDDGNCEPSHGWVTSNGHSWRDGNVDLEENARSVSS